MPEIALEQARSSFEEVELGFEEAQARAEAARCIECGCQVNETCSLRDYCSEYKVEMDRFLGSISKHPIDYSHPFIVRDSNKCINCGRCIRTCAEIQGASVLGFIYRGFSAVMAPEFGESLTQTSCVSCGKCIDVCPVGALIERNLHYKLNPHAKDQYRQNCGLCGVGCDIVAETQGSEVVRISTPTDEVGFNGKNLCFKGRFGWQCEKEKLNLPLIKIEDEYRECSWKEALEVIQTRYKLAKSHSLEITPHVSCEEMLIAERIASTMQVPLSADPEYFSFSDQYLDLSPKLDAYARLDDFDAYVVVGDLNRTLLSMIRLSQRAGKKLILVNYPQGAPFERFADELYPDLRSLPYADDQLYLYNQNRISEELACEIWERAAAKQIMVTTDYMNHSGFLLMQPSPTKLAHVDFALCFGKSPSLNAGFKLAISPYKTDDKSADIILPGPNFLEIEASVLGDNGKLSHFVNPQKSAVMGELLRLFYMMEWISPATADIPHWNALAQDRLAQYAKYRPSEYQHASNVRPSKQVIPSDAPIEEYMNQLYKLRETPVRF